MHSLVELLALPRWCIVLARQSVFCAVYIYPLCSCCLCVIHLYRSSSRCVHIQIPLLSVSHNVSFPHMSLPTAPYRPIFHLKCGSHPSSTSSLLYLSFLSTFACRLIHQFPIPTIPRTCFSLGIATRFAPFPSLHHPTVPF